MKKLLTGAAILALWCSAAFAQTIVPRFEEPNPLTFRTLTSPLTLQAKIDTYGGPPIDLDLSAACSPAASCYATGENVAPGQGHAHFYVEDQSAKGETLVFAATDDGSANDGRVSVQVTLPRGTYCAWVDVTQNDHRTQIKTDGPRAIPPVSSVCFRVLSSPTVPAKPTLPTAIDHEVYRTMFGK